MQIHISTEELAARRQHAEVVLVDSRDSAAFNGWKQSGDLRRGHIPGAVNFPLAWTRRFSTPVLRDLLIAKGITADKTVIVYDRFDHNSTTLARRLRQFGYRRVLIYEDGLGTWAADARQPMSHLARYERLVSPAWLSQVLGAPLSAHRTS